MLRRFHGLAQGLVNNLSGAGLPTGIRYAVADNNGLALHMIEIDPLLFEILPTGTDGDPSKVVTNDLGETKPSEDGKCPTSKMVDAFNEFNGSQATMEAVLAFTGTFASPVDDPVEAYPLGPLVRDGVVVARNRSANRSGSHVSRSYLAQHVNGTLSIGESLVGEFGDELKKRLDAVEPVKHLAGGLARLIMNGAYAGQYALTDQGFDDGVVSNRVAQARTACAITSTGKLLLFVHDSISYMVVGITTRNLAEVILACGSLDSSLQVNDAVLFDGGLSTGLYMPSIQVDEKVLDETRMLPSCMLVAKKK